tara:strand:+ start:641 stop:958 length:318 start_codon:yes stop_codon:yes gene_type:complete
MSQSVIKAVPDYKVVSIKSDSSFTSKISSPSTNSSIVKATAGNTVVSITTEKTFSSSVSQTNNLANIVNVLPFRIRFINVGIMTYSADNPAPIGIAIIGFSNYIL